MSDIKLTQREQTRKEAELERFRRRLGLTLAPALFLLILCLPIPALTPAAHRMAAVVVMIVCLWVTEALPLAVTGLIGPTLVIVLGIAPAAKVFAPFADPIMFLFLGAFILSKSIQLHGLDRRFAYWVLTRRIVGESPARVLFAYGAVCCFISMWISNTATVAMMFPIGMAIIQTLEQLHPGSESSRFNSAIMLICAFGASIGGLATPVGTPPNLIGLGFIERQMQRKVAFFEWMSFGLPIVVALYLALYAYLYWFSARAIQPLKGIDEILQKEQKSLGNISRGEQNTILAFSVTVLLWIVPGLISLTVGDSHPAATFFSKHFPESVAAMIGACLLFLLPLDTRKHTFTIGIQDALKIDWGVMALYGGGIALGQMVFETKLSEAIGGWLTSIIPAGGYALLLIVAVAATMTSELTSNVSSANMVVPVVIALAGSTSLQPAVAACMASSLGFMLPISTPTNAIVYSSGYVPLSRMIKCGVVLDLIGIITIVLLTRFLVPAR